MRKRIRKQLSIVEPSVEHIHGRELQVIRCIVSSCPEILDMIHDDLIRGLRDPDSGRRGLMSAEQVFMVLLIKQMNGFSYDELSFHLADSKTYRRFCGFGHACPLKPQLFEIVSV